ncbi:MAG: BlaI/MecI/CopY family transcriptional regulator [Candidatus Ornithomonoglobus sp.]
MKISDSEMELMQIIWSIGEEVTSAELIERLKEQWKPTTVQTFLKRLTDKEALRVRKEGKTNYYTAAISEDEYKREQTEEFLNEMHKGSVKSLLTSLLGGRNVDKKEAEELRSWFNSL